MAFVQIIEFQTSKADELMAVANKYQDARAAEGGSGPVRVVATKDRDRENTYVTMVTFESYEAAMENSARDDTANLAAEMGALCDAPPTFRNLDVIQERDG